MQKFLLTTFAMVVLIAALVARSDAQQGGPAPKGAPKGGAPAQPPLGSVPKAAIPNANPVRPAREPGHCSATEYDDRIRDCRRQHLPRVGVHNAPTHGAMPSGQIDALASWVEDGKAPATLPVSRQTPEGPRTRMLCAYPKVPKYKGSGSTNDAANYSCSTGF